MGSNVTRGNATWKLPQAEGKGIVHADSHHPDSLTELLGRTGNNNVTCSLLPGTQQAGFGNTVKVCSLPPNINFLKVPYII